MKRYANTKKFIIWVSIMLIVLFVAVVIWRGLKRSSEMRPQMPDRNRTERQAPTPAPDQQPPLEQPGTSTKEEKEAPAETMEALTAEPMFGWPASPYQVLELLEFSKFALAYNEQHEQAAWVAYRLTADNNAAKHERYDRFMADERVSTGSAEPDDYTNSGYDRGHLAPAGDFSFDKQAMRESFYMSNMSPQEPAFNRGIWNKLENQVRDWADTEQEVWVVTGPVLTQEKNMKKIGRNGVSVPPHYYKVVLDAREPVYKIIGFVLPNEGSSKELTAFGLPVDSIEALTGLDFFPLLPDELEEQLESSSNPSQWVW